MTYTLSMAEAARLDPMSDDELRRYEEEYERRYERACEGGAA